MEFGIQNIKNVFLFFLGKSCGLRSKEIIQNVAQGVKDMENKKERLRNMKDTMTRFNIYLMNIPERVGREEREERMIFKETMTENFPELM